MKGLIFSDIMKTRLKYMENSQNPSSVLGSTFSSCMTEVTKEPLFYIWHQPVLWIWQRTEREVSFSPRSLEILNLCEGQRIFWQYFFFADKYYFLHWFMLQLSSSLYQPTTVSFKRLKNLIQSFPSRPNTCQTQSTMVNGFWLYFAYRRDQSIKGIKQSSQNSR